MAQELSTRSLKDLFRFPFQDPHWQGRFLVGTALVLAGSVVPIVPLIFVAGYVLQVMRQVLAGQEPELPAWDDWGRLVRDGLKVSAITLVYLLPALIVFALGIGLYMGASFYLPFASMAGASDAETVGSILLLIFGSMAVLFLSMALGMLLSVLAAIALPLATAHFAAQDNLKAAFRLRQWGRVLKADRLGYFIAWVIIAGLMAVLYVGVILGYYTLVLCFLVPILVAPIGFYVSLVGAALFGQTYRDSVAMLAIPEPVVEG